MVKSSGDNIPTKIQHISYNPRFKYPSMVSRGIKTHQPTRIVKPEQSGLTGYGKGLIYTMEYREMIADLESKNRSSKICFTEPSGSGFLQHLIPHNPFLFVL
jgi:hypothetical protein